MRSRAPARLARLAMILSAAVMIGLMPAVAFAAPIDGDTSVCQGVLSGEGEGPLTKYLIDKVANSDATTTLTYAVVTPRESATRLRDCATVGGTPTYGKDIRSVSLTACPVSGSAFLCPAGSSYYTFTLTVTTADFETKTVCDRAALSGVTATGATFTDYTDKSNLNCEYTPIPVGAVGGIGLMLLTSGLFAAYYVRRRL